MLHYNKSNLWRNSMNLTEALEKVLISYRRYYNILREDEVEAPFVAEALFRSHNEQYFLIKKVLIGQNMHFFLLINILTVNCCCLLFRYLHWGIFR